MLDESKVSQTWRLEIGSLMSCKLSLPSRKPTHQSTFLSSFLISSLLRCECFASSNHVDSEKTAPTQQHKEQGKPTSSGGVQGLALIFSFDSKVIRPIYCSRTCRQPNKATKPHPNPSVPPYMLPREFSSSSPVPRSQCSALVTLD